MHVNLEWQNYFVLSKQCCITIFISSPTADLLESASVFNPHCPRHRCHTQALGAKPRPPHNFISASNMDQNCNHSFSLHSWVFQSFNFAKSQLANMTWKIVGLTDSWFIYLWDMSAALKWTELGILSLFPSIFLAGPRGPVLSQVLHKLSCSPPPKKNQTNAHHGDCHSIYSLSYTK